MVKNCLVKTCEQQQKSKQAVVKIIVKTTNPNKMLVKNILVITCKQANNPDNALVKIKKIKDMWTSE